MPLQPRDLLAMQEALHFATTTLQVGPGPGLGSAGLSVELVGVLGWAGLL